MSSKADVLSKITSSSQYAGSYVKQLINEVTCEENTNNNPQFFKKGDVIRLRINQDGSSKPRPSIVIKVTKEFLVSIPLTSADDINTLCPSTGSRFFRDGNFCNTYVVTALEKAEFIGVYDSPKSLNTAIKNLKEFIGNNI